MNSINVIKKYVVIICDMTNEGVVSKYDITILPSSRFWVDRDVCIIYMQNLLASLN